MVQSVVDAGGHETELVADIIAGAFKSFREDALRLVQGIDGIGQLNLPACSWRLILKDLEDFWCQQVAADYGQVATCIPETPNYDLTKTS